MGRGRPDGEDPGGELMDVRNHRTEEEAAGHEMSLETPGSRRLRRRAGRRVAMGLAIGSLVGLAGGFVIGWVVFGVGNTGFWGSLVGATIFGTAVAVLIAAYSSLESPDPTNEPSEVEHPISDRPGLTVTEGEPGRTMENDGEDR